MEEKTIAQMRRELQEFYYRKVKNNLDLINKLRRRSIINSILFIGLIFSITGMLIFSQNITINGSDMSFIPIIGFVLSFVFIGLLSLVNKDDISNKNNNSNCIEIDPSGERVVKERLMNDFLKIFGDFKWSKGGSVKDASYLKYICSLNIMSSYLLANIDDSISGRYKGVNFRILEFDTSLSWNNLINVLIISPVILGCGGCGVVVSAIILLFIAAPLNAFWLFWIYPILLILALLRVFTYKPFRGVFIEFGMNKHFDGHTFLLENAFASYQVHKNRTVNFEEVKLEDVEFGKKYKIFSDNQIEARYVLTTAFIERFKNIKTAFNAKYVRAAFKDDKIVLAVDAGKDLFAMANINKNTNANTFVELFEEILSILELINALKLNQKTGL